MTGIEPRLLLVARGLSLLAFTGAILILPRPLLAKVIEVVDRVTDRIINHALQSWDDDMADTELAAS